MLRLVCLKIPIVPGAGACADWREIAAPVSLASSASIAAARKSAWLIRGDIPGE